MTTTATTPSAATSAQLRYLKRLAEQAGQTVALPRSRQQASVLISQLRATISQGGGAAEREAEADRDRQAVVADRRRCRSPVVESPPVLLAVERQVHGLLDRRGWESAPSTQPDQRAFRLIITPTRSDPNRLAPIRLATDSARPSVVAIAPYLAVIAARTCASSAPVTKRA